MRYLAALLVISACAPIEPVPPEEPAEERPADEPGPAGMEPERIAGLSIVKQKSGGRAGREHLGALGDEAFGSGGIGSMGFGAGGGGYGRVGTRGAAMTTEGQAGSKPRDDFAERSPFAWAEV